MIKAVCLFVKTECKKQYALMDLLLINIIIFTLCVDLAESMVALARCIGVVGMSCYDYKC